MRELCTKSIVKRGTIIPQVGKKTNEEKPSSMEFEAGMAITNPPVGGLV
jgi:hypothetical protein